MPRIDPRMSVDAMEGVVDKSSRVGIIAQRPASCLFEGTVTCLDIFVVIIFDICGNCGHILRYLL